MRNYVLVVLVVLVVSAATIVTKFEREFVAKVRLTAVMVFVLNFWLVTRLGRGGLDEWHATFVASLRADSSVMAAFSRLVEHDE